MQEARADVLVTGHETRDVVRAALQLFQRGEENQAEVLQRFVAEGKPQEQFYAQLYLGLYWDCQQHLARGREYITAAYDSLYAQGSGKKDMMVAVAQVHIACRGWCGETQLEPSSAES